MVFDGMKERFLKNNAEKIADIRKRSKDALHRQKRISASKQEKIAELEKKRDTLRKMNFHNNADMIDRQIRTLQGG